MTKRASLIADLQQNGKMERSWADLGNLYGLSAEGARDAWKTFRRLNKITNKVETQNYISTLEDRVVSLEEDLKANKAELLYRSKEEIRTLQELIEKTKIDLNKYKIVRWRQNYWGNQNDPHWQVRVDLEPRKLDKDPGLQRDLLLKEIKEYQEEHPKKYMGYDFNPYQKRFLLELSIPDLHIGKLAWGEESGEDYDIRIATERYRKAIATLISRVPTDQIDQIILPVGNDLIHIDNAENQTTSGTPVDTDSRFAKIVKVAKELLVQAIDYLKTIAPVKVVIVRGNHDSTVTFLLGEVLEAWFHADPNVEVDNSPKWRKFYEYGKVGVMFTHGDKEKHEDLGLIFAQEQPQLWARTQYRFVKLGHLHKQKKLNYVGVDSQPGLQIQVIPSLSSTDEWHSSKGYLSNKQAKAFLYHAEEGEIAEYTYTV